MKGLIWLCGNTIMRVWTEERRTYCTKIRNLCLFWHQPAAGRQSGNEKLRIHWKRWTTVWQHCTWKDVSKQDHIFPGPNRWSAFHRHKQHNIIISLFLFKVISNHFWPGTVVTLFIPISQVKWIQAEHLFGALKIRSKKYSIVWTSMTAEHPSLHWVRRENVQTTLLTHTRPDIRQTLLVSLPYSPPLFRLFPKLLCHNSLLASCSLHRHSGWKCHPARPPGDGTSGSRFRPN